MLPVVNWLLALGIGYWQHWQHSHCSELLHHDHHAAAALVDELRAVVLDKHLAAFPRGRVDELDVLRETLERGGGVRRAREERLPAAKAVRVERRGVDYEFRGNDGIGLHRLVRVGDYRNAARRRDRRRVESVLRKREAELRARAQLDRVGVRAGHANACRRAGHVGPCSRTSSNRPR